MEIEEEEKEDDKDIDGRTRGERDCGRRLCSYINTLERNQPNKNAIEI